MAIPMGIGKLGFNNLIFKTKFRFTFEVFGICGGLTVPRHYVKSAARPSLNIEEIPINFLNAKNYIAGKGDWQTIEVVYIDVAEADIAPLFTWLASVYNFTDPVNLQQGSNRRDYSGTAIIKMWDGCGNLIETWTLRNAFPTSINFGDLAYATSEEATISLTLRFSDVSYVSNCPGFSITPCCSGC